MKAIIAKALPATETKPRRIKIMAEGAKSRIVSYNNEWDYEQVTEQYARDLGWLAKGTKMAHGQLPNGDHVACFVS